MRSPWIASLICVLCMTKTVRSAEKLSDIQPAVSIASNLREEIKVGTMPMRDLEIQSFKGIVTITGRVETAGEASVIVNSIVNVKSVQGIRLNLGIGRRPSPLHQNTTYFGNWPLASPKGL